MKKVLQVLIMAITGVILTGGIFVFNRYRQNPEQITPYPYLFVSRPSPIKLDAPVLIVGDRMGEYFAKFKDDLAATISANLAQPIKIQSLAEKGQSLHRTLHQLKGLDRWPQIVIYQGASEEFSEQKFITGEIRQIKENFKLYRDDRIETALVFYPWLSRIVYGPIKRIRFEETPHPLDEVLEEEYLQRLETELLLFEEELVELVNLTKDRGSLLILTTTPINLDIPPKKVCGFTSNMDIEIQIKALKDLIAQNDPKTAYTKSSKLIKQYTGNAGLIYLHGQIAKRLGLLEEAKNSLLSASAYDCGPWRTTEVFNSIIRKVAKNHQVMLFDFALLVEKEWTLSVTYFDEIYPQNIYYEQAMTQLGLVIKGIFKL